MNIELKRRIDELERQLRSAVAENTNLQSELVIALERQTITAQILNVISMSRTDVQLVFDVISESSRRLLGGKPGQPRRDPRFISCSADIVRDSQPGRNELGHGVPLRYRNRTRRPSSRQGGGARQGVTPSGRKR
ncbi:hypothetical protein [Rhizobium rhizogenes]|uniref:hypothetical protein n=1 Tax=Rhizobium rhizogenes TaxID=359 RepID=UPI001E3637A3|nr:hypothetical protein [Rhizobium rhizogenes]